MSKTSETEQDYCLRISLLNTGVWREVTLPGTFTAAKLHEVIQHAMGWDLSHPYDLYKKGHEVPKTTPLTELFSKVGSKLTYIYDFGDSWEHEIVLTRKLSSEEGGTVPRCTGGHRACPPEDCGGVGGYYELLELRAKKNLNDDEEERLEWAGDWQPEHFDLEAINLKLAKNFKPVKSKAKKPAQSGVSPLTDKQGQYLAFIFWYTRVNRQGPAQSDIQTFFGVSAPAVHQMITTLDRLGVLQRSPGQARSLKVLLDEAQLPRLEEPTTSVIRVGPYWVRS